MGTSQWEPVLREPEEAIGGSWGNSPPSVHSRKDSPAGSAPRSRWPRGKCLLNPDCTLRMEMWLPAALFFPHGTLALRPLPSEHQGGILPRGHAHVQGSSGRSCEKRLLQGIRSCPPESQWDHSSWRTWPSVPPPSTCHSLLQARWTLGRDPDSGSLYRKARANSAQCPKRLGLCRASVSLHTPSPERCLMSASYGLEAGTGGHQGLNHNPDRYSLSSGSYSQVGSEKRWERTRTMRG